MLVEEMTPGNIIGAEHAFEWGFAGSVELLVVQVLGFAVAHVWAVTAAESLNFFDFLHKKKSDN